MNVKTHGDRFIASQIEGELHAEERSLGAAYLLVWKRIRPGKWGGLLSALEAEAVFAVLTTERLLLIRTRVGAFAPLLENHGIESIARSDIQGASTDGERIELALRDGRTLAYHDTGEEQVVSGQGKFAPLLVSLFGHPEGAADAGRSSARGAAQRSELIQFAVVMGVLCAGVIYALLK